MGIFDVSHMGDRYERSQSTGDSAVASTNNAAYKRSSSVLSIW
ncbi:MAG: hypothetical protein H6623_00195 [Bdellovibrionaceae bacterium]|nr:hypothetical protein [Pseudobdellovibrionaceae bacterium]